jgi:hypothetical protein
MLLKPDFDPNNIGKVLEEAGLATPKGEQETLAAKLEDNGLGLDNLLNELASSIRGSESEHLRLRAIEMGLKLNGVLKNDSTPAGTPPITIHIHGGEAGVDMGFLKPPPPQVVKTDDSIN